MDCAPLTQYILDRLDVDPGGCWRWTGTMNQGYGRSNQGEKPYAHRMVYELLVGPIPEDLQLDHLCRNTICCNPDHLEPVTPITNRRRGVSGGLFWRMKSHCPADHEYTEANTYLYRGRRNCRACAKARSAAFYAASRVAAS